MSQRHRLPSGGHIRRDRPLRFRFDDKEYQGYEGDTLASALLANGVRIVGRSFKYHRPRGIFSAGAEEPSALVQLAHGERSEPNLRATTIALTDGLEAWSINRWPSVGMDVGALASLVAPILPAGFYYKTFTWPHWSWFEGAIRRAAGLGKAPAALSDPDRYDQQNAQADVLVVGSGLAGLAAAEAAASSGADVLLAEQEAELGGAARWDPALGDAITPDALARRIEALAARRNVRILKRTTIFGAYDHNLLTGLEQTGLAAPAPRQRLWRIRARDVVIATGSIERPLVFPGNDRPGVMLAASLRRYVTEYAVAPGSRAVVHTGDDDAYWTGLALQQAGVEVRAIIDQRATPPAALAARAKAVGIPVIAGSVVTSVSGRRGVASITHATLQNGKLGSETHIDCDLLAVSAGWTPTVHLFSQAGGGLRFDRAQACFRPNRLPPAMRVAGAANGVFDATEVMRDGAEAGRDAANAVPVPAARSVDAANDTVPGRIWRVPKRGKQFVDLQNDVAASDVALAARENYRSVEHLKRYTTTGMGTDQGKTSNVNALAILAEEINRPIEAVGTTKFRPPFTPVTLSVFAGRQRGDLFRPRRPMPGHAWHVEQNAAFEEFGGWERPAFYRRGNETLEAAAQREARAVRSGVGIFESSPLGKIEVTGRDAATFLDRIYVGTASTLKPGKVRYGLMLNELGIIVDDGVFARLADTRFLVSTTSGGVARATATLEEWLQCEWVDLDVFVTNITEQWASVTISGPKARATLARAGTDIELSPDAFPHMSFRDGTVAGIAARIFRVSFTGECSFEINVAAGHGEALLRALAAAGAPDGITPYGIEALMVMRTEKGYLHVGADTDGTTMPGDVGMAGAVAKKASDFIGRRSLSSEAARDPERLQLVGLLADEPNIVLPIGGHIVNGTPPAASQGYVTSSARSPSIERGIALAMLRRGRARIGERVRVFSMGSYYDAQVVSPVFYDPEGTRLHG